MKQLHKTYRSNTLYNFKNNFSFLSALSCNEDINRTNAGYIPRGNEILRMETSQPLTASIT